MNGWKDWETWNCALWLNNDQELYNLMKLSHSYSDLVNRLRRLGITETPDGAAYDDADVDEMEANLFVDA